VGNAESEIEPVCSIHLHKTSPVYSSLRPLSPTHSLSHTLPFAYSSSPFLFLSFATCHRADNSFSLESVQLWSCSCSLWTTTTTTTSLLHVCDTANHLLRDITTPTDCSPNPLTLPFNTRVVLLHLGIALLDLSAVSLFCVTKGV
jgi:hypothetical protein